MTGDTPAILPITMPLQTTVIGSYPKPEYLSFLPDWFNRESSENFSMEEYNKALLDHQQDLELLTEKATREVIDEQSEIGIDVITDGEIVRENYVYHMCRQIKGIDFVNTKRISMRNGACTIDCPVIVSKLEERDGPSQWTQWKRAQAMSKKPVKYTLPGPMTILGSTHLDKGGAYQSHREVSEDLVLIINQEIHALANAGCKFIQVDEPVLVRNPDVALEYGIDHLKRCFQGIGPEVTKVIHLCCGYPNYLDQEDYLKADPLIVHILAEKLDNIGIDQISIEDAHSYNNLELFSKFKKTKVIVGVVKIASSKIESKEEICKRVTDILKYIPSERLILAPDCGLAFLADPELRKTKLKTMVAVAKMF
ncbi:5-methyltetrahydropteroyltriglutamate--homocysteine methyltransferase-like [Lineus longissimus]|uniref:5-methyltetrahydropteroyltriglutamate-- homocysteine methyltransferase-like n=1 Tax=Lineus longissimus TaxID=88925 RepID=UPI002B4C3151